MTVKDSGYDVYKDLFFNYADNDRLWRVLWQEWPTQGYATYTWPDCPNPGVPGQRRDVQVTDAWEFRYDSGRERYLARQWQTRDPNDPNDGGLNHSRWVELGATWTDYLGDEPWNDYDVTLDGSGNPEATERVRFLGGLGIQAQETLGDPADTRFFHGDLIDSTMMTTDECGSMGFQPVSYTAFGEPVWRDGQGQTHVGWPFPPAGGGSPPAGLGTRYQYAGGWGYESGPWGQDPNDAASPGPLVLYGGNPDLPPILLLHVGERWYQPSVGRFVQRDAHGILAEPNVYIYCADDPTGSVDPEGLDRWIVDSGAHEAVIIRSRRGTYTRYDFGPSGGLGFGGLLPGFRQPGTVSCSSSGCIWSLLSPGEKLKRWRPTSRSRDRMIERLIRTRPVPGYNLFGYSCRHFAREVFWF